MSRDDPVRKPERDHLTDALELTPEVRIEARAHGLLPALIING
jgi:hypothetical protein